MAETLSPPHIIRCYFDDTFDSLVPAMCLRWEESESSERIWEVPGGLRLIGPAPERFGVRVRRHSADGYAVRLLWDRTCMYWPTLTRRELMAGSLAPLLQAMSTDLWYLLDQPINAEADLPVEAA